MTFQELKVKDLFLLANDPRDPLFIKTSKTQYAKWFSDRVSFVRTTAKPTMTVYQIPTIEGAHQ